jgi:hypothetical protein
VRDLLDRSAVPDDVSLQLSQNDPDTLCNLSQITVLSGEVELNQGRLRLPAGYSADAVSCMLEADAQTGARRVFTTDYVDPAPLSAPDRVQLDVVQDISGDLLNYRIELPNDEQIQINPPQVESLVNVDVPNIAPTVVPATAPISMPTVVVPTALPTVVPTVAAPDVDGDGVVDTQDNCPLIANPGQQNADGDGLGDACDDDGDNDGIPDAVDNCPALANSAQLDTDLDGQGNACDSDDDNDGLSDGSDPCPLLADCDGDGWSDYHEVMVSGTDPRDTDTDNDLLADPVDPCPLDANCDDDLWPDALDPCPFLWGLLLPCGP